MLTRTEFGLYRPRTIGEDKELEMHALNAPLITADYVSSISQVLSPKRVAELRDLARIIRDTTEPHVRTKIPNDMRLLQDVLFGEMRCYALQGDYRRLTKTAQELRDATKNSQPAPVITESATIISYDADKNKLPDDLISAPFISNSPPIVLEAVESIKNSFGKVSSKLWVPGDKKPGIPIIP